MFLGLRTVVYHVDDLDQAKEWYAALLGYGPYFDEPFYVGFNVGGYELGLDPDVSGVERGNVAVVYWGVADCRATHLRLVQHGAQIHTDLQEVGGGIVVASVKDPWGNIIGIIENPHFKVGGSH
jgi:predicted enzyme related to lactoylglutathione lyase